MFESLAQSLCHLATVATFFATAWSVAHQVPLSVGFPSKNTGVVCHFLLQGSSSPGTESESLAFPVLADRVFSTEPPGKPLVLLISLYN